MNDVHIGVLLPQRLEEWFLWLASDLTDYKNDVNQSIPDHQFCCEFGWLRINYVFVGKSFSTAFGISKLQTGDNIIEFAQLCPQFAILLNNPRNDKVECECASSPFCNRTLIGQHDVVQPTVEHPVTTVRRNARPNRVLVRCCRCARFTQPNASALLSVLWIFFGRLRRYTTINKSIRCTNKHKFKDFIDITSQRVYTWFEVWSIKSFHWTVRTPFSRCIGSTVRLTRGFGIRFTW